MAGVRSSKTVGSTTYKYDTLSGKVMRQSWGSNVIDFVYDENNQPYAMRYNGTVYYYVLNVQGDVVGLLNSSGELVVEYKYDPWGKLLETKIGVDESNAKYDTYNNMALRNPLRYRGYIYDRDTGLYYLQSRYYDPAIGRFINADAFASTDMLGLLSTNMFAYCENNPIMRIDPTGKWVNIVIGAAVGIGEQLVSDIIGAMIAGRPLDENFSSIGTYAAAAVSGALSAIPGGGIMDAAIDIVISTNVKECVDLVTQSDKDEDNDPHKKILVDAGKNAGGRGLDKLGHSLADKIDHSYKGKSKFVKAVVSTTANVVRSAGKYVTHIFDWFKIK